MEFELIGTNGIIEISFGTFDKMLDAEKSASKLVNAHDDSWTFWIATKIGEEISLGETYFIRRYRVGTRFHDVVGTFDNRDKAIEHMRTLENRAGNTFVYRLEVVK